MMWMNEWDIDNAQDRFSRGDTPNLFAGAQTLARLRNWTNRNSDGWAYWRLPSNAARKLMELLTNVDRFDPEDCTEAELTKAYSPIKAFLTRRGVDHSVVFPPPEPRVQQYRIDVRFAFTGTRDEAIAEATRVAGTIVGGMVAAVVNENQERVA